MRYIKPPQNFEFSHQDLTVIGYVQDLAIIEDEYGSLYEMECPNNLLPIGSVTERAFLTPLDELSAIEVRHDLSLKGGLA